MEDLQALQQVPLKETKKGKKRRLRTWERIGKWNIRDIEKRLTFKILSYNVRAQYLVEAEKFPWDVIAQRLFDQIVTLDPDIFCLQEVQETHIASIYSKFEVMGYSCLYKKRTGNEDDGCAIYFKNSVFHMEDHIFVEFNHAFFTILCRHEVGLAVRLVLRDARASALPLIVATTRLCISFRSDYVRLAQLQIFLAHLERFANNGHLQGYHPIILTGCMGAQHNSSVIQFITNGHVSVSKTKINGTEMQNFHPENPPRMEGPLNAWDKCLPYFSELEHPFSFHSVYAHRKKNGSREVTTLFFANWKNFDYIFFSHDSRLRLLARYRLPTEAECRQLFQPLSVPSLKLPSSHFYLAAIFEFGSSSN